MVVDFVDEQAVEKIVIEVMSLFWSLEGDEAVKSVVGVGVIVGRGEMTIPVICVFSGVGAEQFVVGVGFFSISVIPYLIFCGIRREFYRIFLIFHNL